MPGDERRTGKVRHGVKHTTHPQTPVHDTSFFGSDCAKVLQNSPSVHPSNVF